MAEPLVSVIVPVYGAEKYLDAGMTLLLSQTEKDLEVVAVDDGSPDRCGEMLDAYAARDARVRVIHQANGGVSAARNAALAAARGRYLAFVDPDDRVEADFLEKLLAALRETGADIASCGVVNEIGDKKYPDAVKERITFGAKEGLERMCYNDKYYVTLWDKLYKRELWDGVRFPEGKLFEDTAVAAFVTARAEKIVCENRILYHYVNVPSSITTTSFHPGKLDYVDAAETMASFVEKEYPDLKPAADRKRLHALFSTLTLVAMAEKGKWEDVRKDLLAKIRPLKKGVFFDRKAPRRDKIAILSLSLGYPVFRAAWKTYYRIKKG